MLNYFYVVKIDLENFNLIKGCMVAYSLRFLRTKLFEVCQISLEKVIFVIKISWIGCPPPDRIKFFVGTSKIHKNFSPQKSFRLYGTCYKLLIHKKLNQLVRTIVKQLLHNIYRECMRNVTYKLPSS